MMKVETDVTVTNNFAAYARSLVPGLGQVVAKTVADVEAGAKERAPVDTGALRNSIHGEMTGVLEGVVGVGADYAEYVEVGTVRSSAQPYLRPAVDAATPSFLAAVAKKLEG